MLSDFLCGICISGMFYRVLYVTYEWPKTVISGFIEAVTVNSICWYVDSDSQV